MRLYTTQRPLGVIPVGAVLMLPLFAMPLGAWAVGTGVVEFSVCGMKRVFGLPCLSCGATRATLALTRGDLWEALTMQPLIIVLYALLAVWGGLSLWTYVRGRRLVLHLSRREDWVFKAMLVLLPLVNWYYLYVRGI
ncbi:hypothetical protein DL240_13795 [Lujinxingia litoralis]|uniref:DUF2752 domain-containing protein n=1 Tax=Lujinxingia litoralis TaxID=2211119 RepID=A0A328C518_9DELT|nr:DUF2752 domain-containing protein [Lujinxingia litoralis]RAL21200.1 hypothetical protein DL240_13795 [Lujinxingia litoralis]